MSPLILLVAIALVAANGGQTASAKDEVVSEGGEWEDILDIALPERESAAEEEKKEVLKGKIQASLEEIKPEGNGVKKIDSPVYAEPKGVVEAKAKKKTVMPGEDRGIDPFGVYVRFHKKGELVYGAKPRLVWSYGDPLNGQVALPDANYAGYCYKVTVNTLSLGKDPCESEDVVNAAVKIQNMIYGMNGYRVSMDVSNSYENENMCSITLEKVPCVIER